MILRSVIKHVKEQNWFAVGLDFFIVIVGVFIGIQVANWNEGRTEQERGQGYIVRLKSDIVQTQDLLTAGLKFREDVRQEGLKSLRFSQEKGENVDPWLVVVSFFIASQAGGPGTVGTTYEELISTGDVRLITNTVLRNKLADYYRVQPVELILEELPAFRENVRGMIPINLQDYMWTECWGDSFLKQRLKQCVAPKDLSDIAGIAERLLNDELLISQLRYWVSTQRAALGIMQEKERLLQKLMVVIDAELS